jgi:AmpE protein
MKLIIVLAGLLLDRVVPHLHEYRDYGYFLRYAAWLKDRLPDALQGGWLPVVAVMLPPVLLVLFLGALLGGDVVWVFGLLFSIAVLAFCLGPRDLGADVDTYCNVCESTDDVLRARAAAALTGEERHGEPSELQFAEVTRAILAAGHDRIFAVVFWFLLLGPAGAVLYRGLALLAGPSHFEADFQYWAGWMRGVLDWIPSRLTALGYALAGHFDAAFDGWREAVGDVTAGPDRLLVETGLGALDLRDRPDAWTDAEAPRAAMRLVGRTLVLWLVVIAVLTLVGWTV